MSIVPQAVPETIGIERRAIRFQVASPIHIGTREGRLLPMEFLYADNKVHVIDEDKLGHLLKERRLLDEFVNAARTGEIGRGLGWFLRQKGRLSQVSELTQSISSYSVEGGAAEMRDLRPFVRDGFGRVYLPGTSLKGVFRTAVIFALLQANQALRDSAGGEMSRRLDALTRERNKERAKRFFSEKFLQSNLLQSFALPSTKQEQNRDLLRCLKVRDAYPIANNCRTQVLKIQFLSKRKDGSFYWSKQKRGNLDTDTPLSIWLEALVGGTFETEILWDHALFEAFKRENPPATKWPVNGLDELLAHVSNMTGTVITHEKAFLGGTGEQAAQSLKRWYDGLSHKMLRIGFGSGMLGTTVNLLWQDPIRQKIRNVCGHPRGDDPAPKSRRIWQNAKREWVPMGWMRIGTGEDLITSKSATTPEQVKPTVQTAAAGIPAKSAIISKGAPPVRAEQAPDVNRLLDQASKIQPDDSLNLERIIDKLDELEASDAVKVASALRDRLEKTGRWKKHPMKSTIEMFLTE